MEYRPVGPNLFEVVVVSALRAKQLMRGCSPRVPRAVKFTTTARREVVAAKVLFASNNKPAAAAVLLAGGAHALPILIEPRRASPSAGGSQQTE